MKQTFQLQWHFRRYFLYLSLLSFSQVTLADLLFVADLRQSTPVIYAYPDTDGIGCEAIEGNLSHKPIEKCMGNRSFEKKGHEVTVVVLHDASVTPEVTMQEIERPSEFAKNIKSLSTIVNMLTSAEAAIQPPGSDTESYATYRLKHTRSQFSITVSVADKQWLSEEVLTGPPEHLFLSADIILNSAEQVVYNADTGQIESREVPSRFHVGLNYQVGDVLYRTSSWLDGVFLKASILASTRPLESFAIGVGYRPRKLPQTSFFVALNYQLQDSTSSTTSDVMQRYEDSVVVGMSLNIDSALSWLQK